MAPTAFVGTRELSTALEEADDLFACVLTPRCGLRASGERRAGGSRKYQFAFASKPVVRRGEAVRQADRAFVWLVHCSTSPKFLIDPRGTERVDVKRHGILRLLQWTCPPCDAPSGLPDFPLALLYPERCPGLHCGSPLGCLTTKTHGADGRIAEEIGRCKGIFQCGMRSAECGVNGERQRIRGEIRSTPLRCTQGDTARAERRAGGSTAGQDRPWHTGGSQTRNAECPSRASGP